MACSRGEHYTDSDLPLQFIYPTNTPLYYTTKQLQRHALYPYNAISTRPLLVQSLFFEPYVI